MSLGILMGLVELKYMVKMKWYSSLLHKVTKIRSKNSQMEKNCKSLKRKKAKIFHTFDSSTTSRRSSLENGFFSNFFFYFLRRLFLRNSTKREKMRENCNCNWIRFANRTLHKQIYFHLFSKMLFPSSKWHCPTLLPFATYLNVMTDSCSVMDFYSWFLLPFDKNG